MGKRSAISDEGIIQEKHNKLITLTKEAAIGKFALYQPLESLQTEPLYP
jgi:hypothetical protein